MTAAAPETSRLAAQDAEMTDPGRGLLEIVAGAEDGFSSFITGEARLVEADTVWSVKDDACQVWARPRDGSRAYRCTIVERDSLATAREVHDFLSDAFRQALGSPWEFRESRSEESLIRRILTWTRSDGVRVSLTLWDWTRYADVKLEVTAPGSARAAEAPRPVARGEASAAPPSRARTEFQEDLLLAISDGEEDRFSFLAEDEGEVMDGDTVYPALPLPDSEWCDVWGYDDGTREYACVMMHSDSLPGVARRYDSLAEEIRGALGSTWSFRERRNGDRTLTATRKDGARVELWLSNRPGDVNLELSVGAP
jgi:hypothetical protein